MLSSMLSNYLLANKLAYTENTLFAYLQHIKHKYNTYIVIINIYLVIAKICMTQSKHTLKQITKTRSFPSSR